MPENQQTNPGILSCVLGAVVLVAAPFSGFWLVNILDVEPSADPGIMVPIFLFVVCINLLVLVLNLAGFLIASFMFLDQMMKGRKPAWAVIAGIILNAIDGLFNIIIWVGFFMKLSKIF